MTITIKTHLNDGIYESFGGGETHTHYEFTTGPRNLLKACEQLDEHRAAMARSYGNIGGGRSWLEIDGQEIHSYDLEDVARDDSEIEYTYTRAKTRTTKAKELIAKVKAGGYNINKYDCEYDY